jgi:bifunctional DNA-binding transcriptional regulator/antitoxin component of YhaV-PrlF toxin-antitoxin module
MSAVDRPERVRAQDEEIIDSLVPGTLLGRPPPVPAPLPALPPLRLPTDADLRSLLLDMARLDHSGRVYARALLEALGWSTGHRVDVDVVAGALVVGSSATGRHTVGSRGGIRLPAAARRICGIEPGPPVLLIASIPLDVLVVHPASTVAWLILQHHARLEGDRDVC